MLCVAVVSGLGHVVGMRRTGSISTDWSPHFQHSLLYKVPSLFIIKELGRSDEEVKCSRCQAIDVMGMDLSSRAPAEVFGLLCSRAKDWTRGTWLEIEIETLSKWKRKHSREWGGLTSWAERVL